MPILRGTAYVFVVVAGLKLAGSLLVPVLLAGFVAIVCQPAVVWLGGAGLPRGLAVVLVILGVVALILATSVLVVDSLSGLAADLPRYQAKIKDISDRSVAWLEEKGVALAPREERRQLDPDRVLHILTQVAGTAVNTLSSVFLLLLIVIFMLAEASGLPAKLRRAFGDPDAELAGVAQVTRSVQTYLGLKTLISLLTGLLWAALLIAMGIPYAALWGFLAFALNFIPNIGSLLAAVPPILLALLDRGFGTALVLTGGNLAINQVIGNFVEPRLFGAKMGLSPLAVFLSLLFWSWIWGPVGMVLSVPLTMVVKIACDASEDLRPVGILLGPSEEAA